MSLAKTALFVRRAVGGLFAVEDQKAGTGDRIFVHSGTGTDSGGYGTGPDKPCATIDYAIGLCTASEGSQVIVMEGHTEAIIAAATLTMDVAGVQIIGLGMGRLKPQISITTAADATWNVTAANCSIKNVDIISNFLDIASAMTVGASADGLTLDGVGFFDTDATHGSLIGISIAAACSDVTVKNCNYYGVELTAAATDGILCAGAVDRLRVDNCFFTGEFSGSIVTASAAASTNVILTNILEVNLSTTGKGITLNAGTTGIADNVQAYLADVGAGEFAVSGAACAMTDRVRQTNVVTASTFLCIAPDS